jgi:DNA primase
MSTPIEQIKSTITISSLWVKLDSGATPKTNTHNLCPFHGEKTPSLSIKKDDQSFHCFGCGAGGDVIDFFQNWTKTDKRGAVRELCLMLNIQNERPDHKPLSPPRTGRALTAPVKEEPPLPSTEYPTNEMLDFLVQKGVTTETIDRVFNEGSLAVSGGILAFNYNSGVKLRPNYATSRDNRWLRGGPVGGLWRMHALKRFSVEVVWIAEGETDCMRLMSVIPQSHEAVAIPNASFIMTAQLAGLIANNRVVIICTDDDVAGQKAASHIEQTIRVSTRNSTVLSFPWGKRPNSEDASDDICKLSENTLLNLVDYMLTTYKLPR